MADGRWQMAEGTVSRRFKPLVTEDQQAKLAGGIKRKQKFEGRGRKGLNRMQANGSDGELNQKGNKSQGGLNLLPLCEAVSFRAAFCLLPSGAKRR